MRLVDPNDPIFRKPVTRLLCTAVPLAVAAVDLWHGNYVWAAALGLPGLYLGFMLYFRRDAD